MINVEEFHNRNQSDHYTQQYEYDEFSKQKSNRILSRLSISNREPKRRPLILRRGQSFDLKIIFNREFRKGDDLINLVFTLNGKIYFKNVLKLFGFCYCFRRCFTSILF